MPWTTIAIVWGTIGVYGLVNQSWKKHTRHDKLLIFSLLGLSLLLSVCLGINPKLPGLTEGVNALLSPFKSWLTP
ncbi:hypothetical protein FHS16_001587 [Paenibacillus endophyticus]|uniref:Uncharacterized protein n=1 Tax=Paenibacillus endophyticus TaxID=1294268 RepID=A0A7W5G9D7_9BACL|nr:hypothetical protein [Paenibacillus endophyticus]